MTLLESWAASEAGWKAWQATDEAKALPDEEFWEEYARHFTPARYGMTVEIEIEGYPGDDHFAAVDALLAEKGLTGHVLGASRVKDPGHHKAAGAVPDGEEGSEK